MYSFHFDIELNELGRPIIVPVSNTDNLDVNSIEAKFMAAEITRAIYQNMIEQINDSSDQKKLTPDQLERVETSYRQINKLTSSMAYILKNKMGSTDDIKTYDAQVSSETDRDNLNYNGFIYGDKILHRKEGLRVKVLEDGSIYELQNGVDNQHWTKIN